MDLSDIVRGLKIPKNKNVVVGIDTFDDAGVYRLDGDINLIQTADIITPISDDPFTFGRVAAANSLSDVYAMGGKPVTALNICCFPERGIEKQFLAEILQGGLDAINESGAALLGGHTIKDNELKYGLSVTGICKTAELKPNSTARPGDKLILTKPIGTGVIITGSKIGRLGEDVLTRACQWMGKLNAKAAQAMVEHNASSATDITGFGLAGHAYEMARASQVGIRFYASAIPHYPESLEMIRLGVRTGVTQSNQEWPGETITFENGIAPEMAALFFDPQTSGGLLIAIAPERAQKLLDLLRREDSDGVAIVGEVFAADTPRIEVVGEPR